MELEDGYLFDDKLVRIRQIIDDSNADHHVSHVWPSAIVLAQYLKQIDDIKSMIEVGESRNT
jgi:hypothetical protein